MSDLHDDDTSAGGLRDGAASGPHAIAADERLRGTPLGSGVVAALQTAAGCMDRPRRQATGTSAMEELQSALEQILSGATGSDAAGSQAMAPPQRAT